MAQARLTRASPSFAVADVFATAEHYRDRLGFHFDRVWGNPPSFVILDRDDARVMLKQVAADALPRPAESPSEEQYDMYLAADDVTALADELRERGATIIAGPIDRPIYNGRELLVRDCDGRILCFGQLLD